MDPWAKVGLLVLHPMLCCNCTPAGWKSRLWRQRSWSVVSCASWLFNTEVMEVGPLWDVPLLWITLEVDGKCPEVQLAYGACVARNWEPDTFGVLHLCEGSSWSVSSIFLFGWNFERVHVACKLRAAAHMIIKRDVVLMERGGSLSEAALS